VLEVIPDSESCLREWMLWPKALGQRKRLEEDLKIRTVSMKLTGLRQPVLEQVETRKARTEPSQLEELSIWRF